MNWFCTISIKNGIPFISQTDHKLEQTYRGKHIVPFETKDIATFTNQINTRMNSTKSLYYDITEFNKIQKKY